MMRVSTTGVISGTYLIENQAGLEESSKMAAAWIKESLASLFPNLLQATQPVTRERFRIDNPPPKSKAPQSETVGLK